ncbi:MAG: hypothetical protein ISR59_02600 [Anaerolineales bacterium]|uniref:Lipoprotein n=1 Tax=Candidatus Desulfolinea nitratireducens TaxID=2841698 RepID=A0A8J6NFA8_9CHLR|nr:hypothetical protein [Candidatus Desulfolinea nitratireducens]MBL6959972.1 hypothetical protein [Anaerolineales bacterium]
MKERLLLIASFLFLTGCANITERPTTPTTTIPTVRLAPTNVVEELPVADETPRPSFLPQPGDSKLTRASAFAESVDLLSAESDPIQIMLHISGYLPTPCHELRVYVPPPDDENNIIVEMYSVAEPEVICAQVLRAFDVTIEMGNYPKGGYLIWVNDDPIGNFNTQ